MVVVTVAESREHPGYWHLSGYDAEGHAMVAYRQPISAAAMFPTGIGIPLDEAGIEPSNLSWDEVQDPAHIASLQDLCEHDAAFVAAGAA